MPATRAEIQAINRYKRKNLKRIGFEMKLEEFAELKEICDSLGEPVNTFIRAAVRDRMKAESAELQKLQKLDYELTEQ